VTASGAIAAAFLLFGFGAAVALVVPLATRRRLGILHPVAVWLGLEAVFFGVGSLALALGEERPGPALYLGACVFAAALGAVLAHRFGPFAAGALPPPSPALRPRPETGLHRWVPAILAAAAAALLLPAILTTGLPLLSADATTARTALVGLPVQFIRVAIPGLAGVLLLEAMAGRPAFGRRTATWLVIGLLAALMVGLASRYLVIELVAALVLAWLLAGRAISLRVAAVAAIIGLAGFVAIGVLRAPEDFASGTAVVASQRTVSRLFLVQPRTLDALQATIPSEQPYFLGLTWFRRAGRLVGRDDIPNLGYWIYPKVVDAPQAVAGYAAPGLIGEAWANFGPAGVGLFGLLGFGLEGLAAWVAGHRTRVVDIVAGALAILFVARTHALGLLGLAVLLVLVVGWRLLVGARMHRTDGHTEGDG
jgi:hypothetical protein